MKGRETLNEVTNQMKLLFSSYDTRELSWKEKQLDNLLEMLEDHRSEWIQAIRDDFNLPSDNSFAWNEFETCVEEVKYMKRHVKSLQQDESFFVRASWYPAQLENRKDPHGLVLIVPSWNFPMQQLVLPLAGALACGNVCVVKVCELARNVSQKFVELIAKHFEGNCVTCVESDVSTDDLFSQCKFDFVFYGGFSRQVAKSIAKHAAEELTPFNINLNNHTIGIKSPLIVDEYLNVKVACKRIAFSKFQNSGQLGTSPDYILLDCHIAEEFIDTLISTIKEMYGEDPSHHTKMISHHFTQQCQTIIQQSEDKIIYGGRVDTAHDLVEPTLILNPDTENDLVMIQDFTGPILPIIIYGEMKGGEKYGSILPTIEACLELIDKQANGSPCMTLFIFSKDGRFVDYVTDKSRAGHVHINECVSHMAEKAFRNVNGDYDSSVMKELVACFSHNKPVIRKKFWLDSSERYLNYNMAERKVSKRAFNTTSSVHQLQNMLEDTSLPAGDKVWNLLCLVFTLFMGYVLALVNKFMFM